MGLGVWVIKCESEFLSANTVISVTALDRERIFPFNPTICYVLNRKWGYTLPRLTFARSCNVLRQG